MYVKLATAAVAALQLAGSASAAERPLFGPPSAPTVFGRPIDRTAIWEIEAIDLRRDAPTAAEPGRSAASEPTIWGHRPMPSR